MAGRTRTAKALAQRIDLNYFKRPHPFRRLEADSLDRRAGGSCCSGSAGWRQAGRRRRTAAARLRRRTRYSATSASGATSRRRARFARMSPTTCACRVTTRRRTNRIRRSRRPARAAIVEHRGAVRLAATADRDCEQCHRDLNTTTGRLTVAKMWARSTTPIPSLLRNARDARDSRGCLKFNHEVHMKPDLRGRQAPHSSNARRAMHPPCGRWRPVRRRAPRWAKPRD